MTVFPFQIGEVTSLYHRVLKSRDLASEPEPTELKDVVSLSAEARRQKVLEQTQSAVLSRIKNGS
jgi:hypothetical protein